MSRSTATPPLEWGVQPEARLWRERTGRSTRHAPTSCLSQFCWARGRRPGERVVHGCGQRPPQEANPHSKFSGGALRC
jgi:hypothetical protein